MLVIILIILLAVIFYSGSKKDKPISLSEEEETYVNDVLLEDNVAFYKKLSKPDRLRFEQEVKDFVTGDPASKIATYEFHPMLAVVPDK